MTFVGTPAAAAPAPTTPATRPAPELRGWKLGETRPAGLEIIKFDYPTYDYLIGLIPWDSPRLSLEALEKLGPKEQYTTKGTVNYLLSRWASGLDEEEKGVRRGPAYRLAQKLRSAKWRNASEADRDQLRKDTWESWVRRAVTAWNIGYGNIFADALAAATGMTPENGWQKEQRFQGTTARERMDRFRDNSAHGVPSEEVEAKFSVTVAEVSERQLRRHVQLGPGFKRTIVIADNPQTDAERAKAKELQEDVVERVNKDIAAANEKGGASAPLIEIVHVAAEGKPYQALTGAAIDPPDEAAGGVGATGPPSPDTSPPGSLGRAGQQQAASAVTSGVSTSVDSPEEAAENAQDLDALAQDEGYANAEDAGIGQRQLGGVDFSTLELRYVADTYDGGLGAGLQYAYQVDPEPGATVSYGGRRSARLAADSFFTWLALPPESFTVNLNPDDPDDIMDEDLGRTEAGRVLLDADFQMKKTVAKLIHPDAPTGKQFWSDLRGETPCISMRQWIVPRPAVVREQGNELFILDAPLEVKMETEYFRTRTRDSEGCPGHSTADTRHNETVYRVSVLSEVQKAVNEAPEYADLRRVYASRVAAQWYRERSERKPTVYGDLIDSGDVSAWPQRGKWTPMDTWKRFVKSYKDGEFRVRRTTREGTMMVSRLYVYGGVDFSDIPERPLSRADFTGKRPAMDTTVKGARALPVAEAGGGPMWFGGRSSERPEWAPIPPPGSPLGRPVFWAATAGPAVLWMIVAGLLLTLRRRAGR